VEECEANHRCDSPFRRKISFTAFSPKIGMSFEPMNKLNDQRRGCLDPDHASELTETIG